MEKKTRIRVKAKTVPPSEETIRAAATGDAKALEEIYRIYQPYADEYLQRRLEKDAKIAELNGDEYTPPQDMDDAMQEIWAKILYEDIPRFWAKIERKREEKENIESNGLSDSGETEDLQAGKV